jgi:hypothetical protein
MKKLHVKNIEEKILWDLEMLGQLSDGAWENASPRDHWKGWVEASVSSKQGVQGYAEKTNYNFTSKWLLDIIGMRMLSYLNGYAYFKKKYGANAIDIVKDYDGILDMATTMSSKEPSKYDVVSQANYLTRRKDDKYYKEQIVKIFRGFSSLKNDEIDDLLTNPDSFELEEALTLALTDFYTVIWEKGPYTLKMLKGFLQNLKSYMKISLGPN